MVKKLTPTTRRAAIAGLAFVCAFAGATTNATFAQSDDIKIGFLLKTMQEARYQTDKSLFIARAESKGAQVMFDSSGNDPLRQLQQFEEMLDSGVSVIVLQPVNTQTSGSLVNLAHEKGVRVVGYDSLVQNGPLDVMVMQDSWTVGRLQGEAMVEWFKKTKGEVSGRVALIKGQPGDANAEALSSGVLEVLADFPKLELVAERSHVDWSPDLSRETAESLLIEHDNGVDAFICNNSGLAYGVIAALRDENLASTDKVFVAGADADLRNIRLIVEGAQALDVWKKIKPLAYKAADVAIELAASPETDAANLIGEHTLIDNGHGEVPTIITPVVGVSKNTIDSTVIEGGFFTSEQVYGDNS